jgi:uncharacterized protein YigA (DUF484 family)
MTETLQKLDPAAVAALRASVLTDPALVLDDRELMAALIDASGGESRNVVDLRGALVRRLEERLARLEQAHRSVIAAAYENLAGAGQIHRASLALLEAPDAECYLRALLVDATDILALDAARLVLEHPAAIPAGTLAGHVVDLPEGGVDAYLDLGDAPDRDGVWLRSTPPEAELIFGDDAPRIGSEALIVLQMGARRGLLAFGAEDARRFSPEHGVDLVSFLGGVVARTLPRWLT